MDEVNIRDDSTNGAPGHTQREHGLVRLADNHAHQAWLLDWVTIRADGCITAPALSCLETRGSPHGVRTVDALAVSLQGRRLPSGFVRRCETQGCVNPEHWGEAPCRRWRETCVAGEWRVTETSLICQSRS